MVLSMAGIFFTETCILRSKKTEHIHYFLGTELYTPIKQFNSGYTFKQVSGSLESEYCQRLKMGV